MTRQIDNYMDAWTQAFDAARESGASADEAIEQADHAVADLRPADVDDDRALFGGLSGGL